MTTTHPTEWRPIAVEEVQRELGAFRNWVLCGGYSVDRWVGRSTRVHGDLDVGVFRSEVRRCCEAIGRDRVYLCSPPGTLVAWNGHEVPQSVHDIWIADRDRAFWTLQIMIYDDDGDWVAYRRDRRIRWPKQSHSIDIDGISVLNPLITVLFKANKSAMEEKEAADISTLVQAMAELALPRTRVRRTDHR